MLKIQEYSSRFNVKTSPLINTSYKDNLKKMNDTRQLIEQTRQVFKNRLRKLGLGHWNENHRFWSPRAWRQGCRIKISLFGSNAKKVHYLENFADFQKFCHFFFREPYHVLAQNDRLDKSFLNMQSFHHSLDSCSNNSRFCT